MSKKHRAESEADATPAPATPAEQPQEKETEEVKEVTKGVKEVELGEKPAPSEASSVEETEVSTDGKEAEVEAPQAAAVPLPDSPELKAVDGEDIDAEGEADADADAEADEGEEPKSTKEVPAPAEAATDEEVPGLSLASASPKKAQTTEARP